MFILFQGTMEEKIYERQVTKQSLSQRVIDEHQIDRHFNSNDLRELYLFRPDRLDDPNRKERPTPALPKVIIISLKNSTLKTKNMTNYQNITVSLYPHSPKGEGGILFYLCPSVRPRYFSQ